MRPPMPFAGGKQIMSDQIVGLMEPHDHYVEPFFGGGSVLFSKSPAQMETVNDLDGDLVTFWRVLRDRPHELAWVCGMTPHSRKEMELTRTTNDSDPDDLERARRVWVLLTQGRAARLTTGTGWRYFVSAAAKGCLPEYLDGYLGRFLDAAARLRGVSLECRDAVDVISAYDAPGTCFYVDPPYLGRDRLYTHEMPSEADHHRLLETLTKCRGQVILSGYQTSLYDEALRGWERTEVRVRDQASRDRVEVLWVNRMPHPTLLEVTA